MLTSESGPGPWLGGWMIRPEPGRTTFCRKGLCLAGPFCRKGLSPQGEPARPTMDLAGRLCGLWCTQAAAHREVLLGKEDLQELLRIFSIQNLADHRVRQLH